MLILTRRLKETVIIGDNEIRLIVLAINGDKVKLGIDADRDIEVHREEIYNKIKNKEKKQKS